jgi:hypothetical protein
MPWHFHNSMAHIQGDKMYKFSVLVGVAAFGLLATSAYADISDPALFQDGSHCSGTYWCSSTTVAVDPNTGDDTLEFIINTSVNQSEGITLFTTGWVKAVTGSTVDDLLDFENIGGKNVLFLYCGDSRCSSDDVGLPAISTAGMISFTDGALYTPTSGQPGFGDSYSSQGVLSDPTIYSIIDPAEGARVNGVGVSAVPEPSSVLLFGGIPLVLAGALRRRHSSRKLHTS